MILNLLKKVIFKRISAVITGVAMLGLALTACENTNGEIKGKVTDGVEGVYGSWAFVNPGDYTYNSSYIEVSGGKASLKAAVDTTATLGSGTYVGTAYSAGALRLDSTTGADTSLSSSWAPKWSSLQGYWKMDGDWLDASGNGRNGTGQGGVLSNGSARVGTASGVFDGTNDYVDLGNTTAFDFGTTTSFSLSAWAKWSSCSASNRRILSNGSSGNSSGFALYCNGALGYPGRLSLSFSFGGDSTKSVGIVTVATDYNDDQWHHVVVSVDQAAKKVRFYVDGALASITKYDNTFCGSISANVYDYSSASCASTANNSGRSTIGSDRGSALFWSGQIDDAAIWSAALTEEEVALIYHRQKQKFGGLFTSSVIDLGASGTWTSFAPVTPYAFHKELASSSETSYSAQSSGLADDLVGLWHMNGTSGVIADDDIISDSSSAGRNGQAKDSDGANTLSYNSGKLAGALLLDGANDYVDLGNAVGSAVNAASGFTVSAWIFNRDLPATGVQDNWIFGMRVNGALAGYELLMDGSNLSLAARSAGADAYRNVSAAFSSTNAWHHVVGVADYAQGRLRLYLDGVEVANQAVVFSSTSFILGTPTQVDRIGSSPGSTGYFNGYLDEVIAWKRPLSATEALDLFRRGANRVKYQVRSCANATCSCKTVAAGGSATDCSNDGTTNDLAGTDANQAGWIGPDGTGTTYFSELQNNASVDSSGNPTGAVNASGLTLDWSGSFFPAAARPVDNRYFQYRALMESDDEASACGGSACLPSVSSVALGPTHYYSGSPTIQNNSGVSYQQLRSFAKTDTNACTKFQISNDGVSWKYWDGSAWASATTSSQTNFSSDLNSTSLAALGSGTFYFKAFLNTNGSLTQSCELQSVGVLYR